MERGYVVGRMQPTRSASPTGACLRAPPLAPTRRGRPGPGACDEATRPARPGRLRRRRAESEQSAGARGVRAVARGLRAKRQRARRAWPAARGVSKAPSTMVSRSEKCVSKICHISDYWIKKYSCLRISVHRKIVSESQPLPSNQSKPDKTTNVWQQDDQQPRGQSHTRQANKQHPSSVLHFFQHPVQYVVICIAFQQKFY